MGIVMEKRRRQSLKENNKRSEGRPIEVKEKQKRREKRR